MGLKEDLKMLVNAFSNLALKPITLPTEEAERVFDDYSRGVPTLIPDKCVGCSLCAMYCPASAITMVPGGKRVVGNRVVEIKNPSFDYSKCIYCGLCSNICKSKAIDMRRDLEPVVIVKIG